MMKRIFMGVCAMVCALSASAKGETAAKDTAVFKVGMHCQGCVNRITKELTYTAGVTDLKVELKEKTVWVEYKPKKISEGEIEGKLKGMGYEVERKGKE